MQASEDSEPESPETVEIELLAHDVTKGDLEGERSPIQLSVDVSSFVEAGKSIVAETSVDIEDFTDHGKGTKRLDRGMNGMVEAFKNKQWGAIYPEPPIGYQERDDGWIEPDAEAQYVEDLFVFYIEDDQRGFHGATERFNETYPDIPSTPLEVNQVQNYIDRPLYIGEPTMSIDHPHKESSNEVTVEDPCLEIVDEVVFAKAQRLRDERSGDRCDDDDVLSLSNLESRYDSDVLVKVIDEVVPTEDGIELESSCCGSSLTPKGASERAYLQDFTHVPRYVCDKCGERTTVPLQTQMFDLALKSRDDPS